MNFLYLPVVVVALLSCCAGVAVAAEPVALATDNAQLTTGPATNPLKADRVMEYLQQVCAIGPRPSGSDGMKQQIKLLQEHFQPHVDPVGGLVELQAFRAPNPLGAGKVRMKNFIVRWRPEAKERILLCAHYDTRPLPDRDPNRLARRNGTFIGANDGGSGTAVLMELAHHMPALLSELDENLGVDFALFDGEELVYVERRDPYFLGSKWFATKYKRNNRAYRYRWGVLLDMVGDKDLELYQEKHSVSWKETRPLVNQIWATAGKLGVEEFVPRTKRLPAAGWIRDDHLMLRNKGQIPTCDIIDLDYPHWHTEQDLPRNCSGESMARVGWVVLEWLKTQQAGETGRASR